MPFRILPALTDRNRHFWTSGADGRLQILRCQDCGYYLHPPTPVCPIDLSKRLVPEVVSGRGTIETFTINHKQWMPGPEAPYVVAIVELVEQAQLRLTTNVVGCTPEEVYIGMPVQVTFEHHSDDGDEVWLPLFEPCSAVATEG